MRSGIVLASFVLGAALAGVITLATKPATDDDPMRPARRAVADTATDRHPTDTPADRLQRWAADSLARPLFNPDRHPIAQARAGSDAAAGLPRLSGIMITPAGRRAIFATSGGGKPDVVGEGGSVGGDLVESIGTGEVVLIGPDGRHSLHPTFDHAPPGAMTAPPIIGEQALAKEATR